MDNGFVEHDPHHLDKVVGDITSDLIHRFPLLKCMKCSMVIPTSIVPTITKIATVDMTDVQRTQDSLSFPTIPLFIMSTQKLGLQEENNTLRARLAKLATIYYHWKVACIFFVDKSQQVAQELDKV